MAIHISQHATTDHNAKALTVDEFIEVTSLVHKSTNTDDDNSVASHDLHDPELHLPTVRTNSLNVFDEHPSPPADIPVNHLLPDTIDTFLPTA
jgi:hypothetical protein